MNLAREDGNLQIIKNKLSDLVIEEGKLKVDAELEVSDIQIGVVEIKNKDTDDRVKVNPDGSMDVNVKNDPLIEYKDSDIDTTSPNYYGFIAKDGKWYIMKETIIENAITYRYVKGDSNYSENWANRGNLVYDYFDVVFGG